MSAKVLVVDDEISLARLMLQKFKKNIRADEFEFLFAQNGVEALEILQSDSEVQMVITDINMPEMDGLTLLENIQSLYPKIKTVVVSAYEDMKNFKAAIKLGAFDFLTKPIDFQELERSIRRTLAHVQANLAQDIQIQALQRQNRSFSSDVDLQSMGQSLEKIRAYLKPTYETVNQVIEFLAFYHNLDTREIREITNYLEDTHLELNVKNLQKQLQAIELELEALQGHF